MAAEIQDAASDRAKKQFEDLGIGSSENVGEYFARVNVTISKQQYDVTIPQTEIHRHILFGLSSRFRHVAHSSARAERYELCELGPR